MEAQTTSMLKARFFYYIKSRAFNIDVAMISIFFNYDPKIGKLNKNKI